MILLLSINRRSFGTIVFWVFLVDYRKFNEIGMAKFIKDKWLTRGQIKVYRMKDIYVFHCMDMLDKEDIIDRSIAVFDGAFIVFTKWQESSIPFPFHFPVASLWVRVCGLPFQFLNMHVGSLIGHMFGENFMVEHFDNIPENDYLRIRVEVQLQNPLIPRFFIVLENGCHLWVQFNYEGIVKYCVKCGRVGHKINGCVETREGIEASLNLALKNVCEKGFDVIQTQSSFTMFNLNLRTLPTKHKRFASRVGLGYSMLDDFEISNVNFEQWVSTCGRVYPGMSFQPGFQPFSRIVVVPGVVLPGQDQEMESPLQTSHNNSFPGNVGAPDTMDGVVKPEAREECDIPIPLPILLDPDPSKFNLGVNLTRGHELFDNTIMIHSDQCTVDFHVMNQHEMEESHDQISPCNKFKEEVVLGTQKNSDGTSSSLNDNVIPTSTDACSSGKKFFELEMQPDKKDSDISNKLPFMGTVKSSDFHSTMDDTESALRFPEDVDSLQENISDPVKQGYMCVSEKTTLVIAEVFFFRCLSQKNGNKKTTFWFRKHKHLKIRLGYMKHRNTNKRKAATDATLAVMALAEGDYDVFARTLTLWSNKRACTRGDIGSHNYFSGFSENITTSHIYPGLDQETETIVNEVGMTGTYKRTEMNLFYEVRDVVSSSVIEDYGPKRRISKCDSVSEISNVEQEDGKQEGREYKLKRRESISFGVKVVVTILGKRKASTDLLEIHMVGSEDGPPLASKLWRMEKRLRLESNAFNPGLVLDEKTRKGAMFRMANNFLVVDSDNAQGHKLSITVGDEHISWAGSDDIGPIGVAGVDLNQPPLEK